MNNDILHTIRYFLQFQYPPSLRELHTFHPEPISLSALQQQLDALVRAGELVRKKCGRKNNYYFRYTLEGYVSFFNIWKERYDNSNKKLVKKNAFVSLLSRFTAIQLIGLSGSVAMKNADTSADIDLFIITAPGRLWTARLISLILAYSMGVRRKRGSTHVSDTICLNLFFDTQDMAVPVYKRSEYTAHEVLQMMPLYSVNNTYDRFIEANTWVFTWFPNAQKHTHVASHCRYKHLTRVGTIVEKLWKRIQLHIIHRHLTTEIITPTQLWFFPDDYEKKVNKTI